MANISITAKFVLQAAKLYHKEQSPGIETMSTSYSDFRPIVYYFCLFRFFKINLTISSKNGKPMTVPTTEPTTPVDPRKICR